MTQRLEAKGPGITANHKWDDGSDHDDVTKIYVRGGSVGIQIIKFEYVRNGQLKDGSFHGCFNRGFGQTFEIDHLKDEHLVAVECYGTNQMITGLQFKTNLKIHEFMGYENGDRFTLAVDGKKIIGFHGSTDTNDMPVALGAYVTWITPTRMEAQGGKEGDDWDDGADYEAVTKIHIRSGFKVIQEIKFDYVDKDGHAKEGLPHGSTTDQGFTLEPFEISHQDKEYLLSIDGYFDENNGVIQALQFRTNMKTSELMGYNENGTKFSLGYSGNKIIGFHGYAAKNLKSLGVYITKLPLTKLEYIDSTSCDIPDKGCGGVLWDDGTFQGVRKVYVYYNDEKVISVRFEYDNGGKVETRQHGSKVFVVGEEEEFVLDYPTEYITYVEGTINTKYVSTMIKSLTFKTSKGRASPTFGNGFCTDHHKFVLQRKGCAIVGFHGRSSYGDISALGAYFFPMPPPHDV